MDFISVSQVMFMEKEGFQYGFINFFSARNQKIKVDVVHWPSLESLYDFLRVCPKAPQSEVLLYNSADNLLNISFNNFPNILLITHTDLQTVVGLPEIITLVTEFSYLEKKVTKYIWKIISYDDSIW